jgi:hypothetical protein
MPEAATTTHTVEARISCEDEARCQQVLRAMDGGAQPA